ncbi:MAG: DUF3575 domain-containing protein [Ignavibacteria bacterium]|nr:DUF3575 domain-containing protein [Ignavibacteria bacterium]
MRRLMFISLSLFFLFGSLDSFAQPKRAITINPIGLVFGTFNAQFELALSERNAVAIRGNYVGYDIGSYKNSAFGGGAHYKWYFNNKAITGIWAGPAADVLLWTADWDVFGISKSETTLFAGVGADLGYKWAWGKFCLELSAGGRFYFGEISGLSFGGFLPSLGLGVGYAW